MSRGDGESGMEMGVQPLDAVMERSGLSNADVVGASDAQLTFKQLGKARRGRRLTMRMQKKVLAAVNASGVDGAPFALEALFNYRGR